MRLLLRLAARLLLSCFGLTLLLSFIGHVTPKQVIAFVSDRDGGNKIYLVDIHHSLVRKLSDQLVASCCLSWSPDGRQMIFPAMDESYAHLYHMDMNGSDARLLTSDPGRNENNAAWSPDGQKVAFMRNPDFSDWEIMVTDIRDGATWQLTNNTVNDVAPLWSPDEQYILFTASRGNDNAIYRVNLDGNSERLLTARPLYFTTVALSPDGKTILFNGADRVGNADIYVMNANGVGEERLTDGGAIHNFPAYSPDGQQIVFVSNRDGDEEIYVMNADGGHQEQLTDNESLDWLPSWSPDGGQILFLSHRDGNTELYLMDADGQNQRRLTDNPALDTYPAWQP